MGSYADLVLGPFRLGSHKYEIDPLTMMLFRESDKRVHKATPEELKSRYGDDIDLAEFDKGEITTVEYACTVPVVRDRLELFGFTRKAAETEFYHSLQAQIAQYESWGRSFKTVLTILHRLDLEQYLACLLEIKQKKLQSTPTGSPALKKHSRLMRYILSDMGLYGFPGNNHWHFLRLLLDVCSDSDELVYDLTDLVSAGQVHEDDNLVEYANDLVTSDFLFLKKFIVITEGETDRWILQRSLALLYPHLLDYFHFLDFKGAKVEGGAGSLANIVKAFAAAGIMNRIIAFFDNDTAAESALRGLSPNKLPKNIALRKYPHLMLADDYPTQGPTGVEYMNVNGMAGSIELYLGKDVLQNSDGSLTPVQWKGYDYKLRQYQGEIVNKLDLQNKFEQKLAVCEVDPSRISEFDWEGIRSILNEMRTVFGSSEA